VAPAPPRGELGALDQGANRTWALILSRRGPARTPSDVWPEGPRGGPCVCEGAGSTRATGSSAWGSRRARARCGGYGEAKVASRPFDSFARTLDYIQRERDLLFAEPASRASSTTWPALVLVVVRGYNHREDLACSAVPPRRETRSPSASTAVRRLIEAGYRPDIILGDMDAVATPCASHCGSEALPPTPPTEIVVQATRTAARPASSPRRARRAVGPVRSCGRDERGRGILLAREDAETIVAVGPRQPP